MGPLFFLLFTSGTWFIASFHAHNHAPLFPLWINEKSMDGEVILALVNDRKPHQKFLVQVLRHTIALCLSMSNMIHVGMNFLLTNELKRRFWNILWGFMEVRDLRMWVSWSSRNCQWLYWEEHRSIRKKKWDMGLIFSGIGKHAINARYYSRDRWHGRCCERKMNYY